MVVHVAPRGKDMPGLMRYLYGPGKANEHTNQRAVAASSGLHIAYAGALSPVEASELGRVVESAWREQMIEAGALVGAGAGSRAGVSRASLKAGAGAVADEEKEHVYHVIVSLPPASTGAGWTDKQWAVIAQDVMTGMGFSDGPDSDLESDHGARWVAVHHGASAGGNDHLHIAASMVRQDGRRVQVGQYDYARANDVRRHIEQTRAFVLPLQDAGLRPARPMPAVTMAEHAMAREASQATGVTVVPDRVQLQHIIRSAAAASSSEVEWLNAVLDAPDVEIEAARWAAGGRDVVVGYKVRLGDGAWFNASQLAPDLTLSQLRPAWAAHETDETRAAALAIWRADGDLPPVMAPTAVTGHLDTAQDALSRWAEDLQSLDPTDGPGWRRAARETAGVVSSLARDPGPEGSALVGVAQTLSRQALRVVGEPRPLTAPRPHRSDRPDRPDRPDPVTAMPDRLDRHDGISSARVPRPFYGPAPAQLAARHIQLALRAGGTASHPGWIAVLQQLCQVLAALEAAQRARHELVSAQQLAAASHALNTVAVTAHQERFEGRDIGELHDAWHAREASRTGSPGPGRTQDHLATGTHSPYNQPQVSARRTLHPETPRRGV